MPQGNPKSGEFYRHFKNKLYQVLHVAIHSETREELVIYQALYDDYKVYARPLSMFTSEVDHEKYPEVTQKYRFQEIPQGSLKGESPVSKSSVAPQPQVVESTVSNQEDIEPGVNQNLLRFLDTDNFDEKYIILKEMESEIDDVLLDNMAASIDVVIPDGPIDKRIDHLRYAVKKRMQFENDRLR